MSALWDRIGIDPAAAFALVLIGIVLDLFTLSLAVARSIRGKGPSGIPGIPWLLYLYAIILSREPTPFNGEPVIVYRLVNLTALTLFHGLCQFILPQLLCRRRS